MNQNYFYVCLFVFLLNITSKAQNSVGIGTLTPNAKAVLELVSLPANTQGLLLPRVSSLPTGYTAADAGMMVFHTGLNVVHIWNGTAWVAYNNASSNAYWALTGQVIRPTNGAKDVQVDAGWLATNNRLYIGVAGGGSQGPAGNLFFGTSEVNLSKNNGNKINFLDGFNKRISADATHFTLENQENNGTSGVTISSFLLNNTNKSSFRVGTAAQPHQLTLLTQTGNLGIGTSIPTEKLTIKDTASSTANANISLVSGLVGSAALYMGNPTNALMGMMRYNNSTNSMDWFTNNILQMKLTNTGNLGIGTAAPAEKLSVAGNTTIPAANDYRYNTPKTYHKTIAPVAFIYSGSASGRHEVSVSGNSLNLDNHSSSVFGYSSTWLDLPEDAIITSIMISYVDNSNNSNHYAEANLYRTLLTSGVIQNMASVSSSADANSTSIRTKTTNTISDATIDNENYFYTIGLVLGNIDKIVFHGVRITYQISKVE